MAVSETMGPGLQPHGNRALVGGVAAATPVARFWRHPALVHGELGAAGHNLFHPRVAGRIFCKSRFELVRDLEACRGSIDARRGSDDCGDRVLWFWGPR